MKISSDPYTRNLVEYFAGDAEEAYLALKHAVTESEDKPGFERSDYRAARRELIHLAGPHYPYRMAAKMLLKPLGLNRYVRRAAVALLSVGARYLLAH